MAFGKSFKKWVKKGVGLATRFAVSGATMGNSELFGYGKKTGELAGDFIGSLNGANADEANAEARQIALQEAESTRVANQEYYDNIMKRRSQRIADFAGSQVNYTTEQGLLGDYDNESLGDFNPELGTFGIKKKKVTS